jgi:selenide,water dikinase
LVDGGLMDDAAIIKVNADLALVQTLDFFTPIVDSPYLFGQIAAANALSDVYAMGGTPQTAMAILAFPLMNFSQKTIAEVLQGASDKIGQAQAAFVGGHSIDDDTLKFGLSVTGYVHPEKVWSNAKAKVGDHLILTKAIGTGTATAALKRGEVTESDIKPQLDSMAQLNQILTLLNSEQLNAIHSATDVTGFGLSGHLVQMARASHVKMHLDFSKVPVFKNTLTFLEAGFLTKAHRTNQQYVQDEITMTNLSPVEEKVLFDPQTSGGLLLSVDAKISSSVVESLKKQFSFVSIVGEVSTEQAATRLEIVR